LHEHLEYFPFGEQWVEEGEESKSPLYRFTAKELDPETGLYYFGARYYDPRTSVWISADPILGKYLPDSDKMVEFNFSREPHWAYRANLPGMGGMFNSGNLAMYTYTHQNPIRYVDPDGKEVWIVGHVAATPLGRLKDPDAFHLSLFIKPDKPKDFANEKGMLPLIDDEVFTVLGGQPFGGSKVTNPLGNLRGVRNNPEDLNPEFMQKVETPQGMSDTDFIKNILKAAGRYKGNLNYDIIPESGTDGYNSNSYVSGLIKAAGGKTPDLKTNGQFQTPGYEKPIPIPNK